MPQTMARPTALQFYIQYDYGFPMKTLKNIFFFGVFKSLYNVLLEYT